MHPAPTGCTHNVWALAVPVPDMNAYSILCRPLACMSQELQAELEQDQVIHASGFSPSWLHIPQISAAEFCTVRAGFVCSWCLASFRLAGTAS